MIRGLTKDGSLSTGFYDYTLFDIYPYMFEPDQLIFIASCVRGVADVPGAFVEAGCAHGAAAVFLSKDMASLAMKLDYYAVDTLSGFVREHAELEVQGRGKPESIRRHFQDNKQACFDKSMSVHGLDNVNSVRSDVARYDFASITPIAFCLLDVALYIPIKEALPQIHAAMAPGGIIIVDDCKPKDLWDGAYQAYTE